MVKRCLVLFTLFSICLSVKGQAALLVLLFGDQIASENFHLSLDLGANISSLPGVSAQQVSTGLYFGLGTYIKINNKWALTPEFKPISPRGARGVLPLKDYSAVLSNPKYDIRLNYIDVPVLLQYSAGEHWLISAGPQISFLTQAQQLSTGNLIDGSEVDVVQRMKDNFNNLYFSAPLEVGYRLLAARNKKGLHIKARYNIGLSEIFAEKSYGSSLGSTFQIFLSLPFVNKEDI